MKIQGQFDSFALQLAKEKYGAHITTDLNGLFELEFKDEDTFKAWELENTFFDPKLGQAYKLPSSPRFRRDFGC